MSKYHKINSIYKRDEKGQFMDIYSQPEFAYLYHSKWVGTEKIDGTNIRIIWDGKNIDIKGRTDKAEIPLFLHAKLLEIVAGIDFKSIYPIEICPVVLYGEGYGNKIQKVGSSYNSVGVDFVLFDIYYNGRYLMRIDRQVMAERMKIDCVPLVFSGSLEQAEAMVKKGFKSLYGEADAEGLVLTPTLGLLDCRGKRIITKIKTKDYRNE